MRIFTADRNEMKKHQQGSHPCKNGEAEIRAISARGEGSCIIYEFSLALANYRSQALRGALAKGALDIRSEYNMMWNLTVRKLAHNSTRQASDGALLCYNEDECMDRLRQYAAIV